MAEEYLEFLEFKKLRQATKSHSKASSTGSSADPFGGPCAQDPFDI